MHSKDSAFPIVVPDHPVELNPPTVSYGIDLRTYIATACLQGLLANSAFVNTMAKEAGSTPRAYQGMAKVAAMGADALIAELNGK
jgi:hypothetical protein